MFKTMVSALRIFALLALLGFADTALAQVYSTRTGKMHFYSASKLEDIEATSKQSECALSPANGRLSARVAMQSFVFDKALMQRHFNENYVESDKYPTAVLEAKLQEPLTTTPDGVRQVTLAGNLTLHGVTKAYTIPGQVEIKGGVPVRAQATFPVKLADHNIKIPTIVTLNIAEMVQVDVDFTLETKSK